MKLNSKILIGATLIAIVILFITLPQDTIQIPRHIIGGFNYATRVF